VNLNGRAFVDRAPAWTKAGKVAFGVGLVVFAVGYLLAFSIPGTVLWFAGAITGVAGLVIWLVQYRAAWVPLGSLTLILLLFVLAGIIQLVE
jgi:hypothetical protein